MQENTFIKKKLIQDQESRIALCLNGQLRPGWRDSLKHLIDSFSHLGNIDVFLYSWDMESLWPGVGGNGIGWVRRFFQPMLNECPRELIMSNIDFSKKFPNVFNVISREFNKKNFYQRCTSFR